MFLLTCSAFTKYHCKHELFFIMSMSNPTRKLYVSVLWAMYLSRSVHILLLTHLVYTITKPLCSICPARRRTKVQNTEIIYAATCATEHYIVQSQLQRTSLDTPAYDKTREKPGKKKRDCSLYFWPYEGWHCSDYNNILFVCNNQPDRRWVFL